MPDTYSQIYIQIVFAVKGRENLIHSTHREELHKYISGIIEQRKQKMLSIFCMPDHLHLFVGLAPSISISDLVRDVKAGSSNFINKRNWINKQFNWQAGFGAFSYSKTHVDAVVRYILNQEKHHQKKSFKEEYINILERFEIEYKPAYLFDWIE
jgi:putative transposase